jgi:hypothetical protein
MEFNWKPAVPQEPPVGGAASEAAWITLSEAVALAEDKVLPLSEGESVALLDSHHLAVADPVEATLPQIEFNDAEPPLELPVDPDAVHEEDLPEASDDDGGAEVVVLHAEEEPKRAPFSKLRRKRAAPAAETASAAPIVEDSLETSIMLLREENARLKAERHRELDVGVLISKLRSIADEQGPAEALDETWSTLSECLVIREELIQACSEIHDAIDSVERRLGSLAIRIYDATGASGPSDDPLEELSRASGG